MISGGATFFLNSFAATHEGTTLTDMEDALFKIPSSVNGSGNLAVLTFKVVGYGETGISFTTDELFATPNDSGPNYGEEDPILHSTQGAIVNIVPPPPSGPIAKFSLPNGGISYVGDLLILDASNSIPGFDVSATGQGVLNNITQYTWSIDFNNDGVVDLVLQGSNVSVILPNAGTISVTLTVTAPDSIIPQSQSYSQTNSLTQTINVQTPPTMANIDVYTARGGNFANQSSDAYGPQELVTIYALVTYNDVPVVGKDVVFEIITNNGAQVDYQVARSDNNGIATISFRMPWPDVNPESLMGNWTIIGTVDISQQSVTDICPFQFGYIINIDSVVTAININQISSNFARGNILKANITIENIRSISITTIMTFTIYDEANVPVTLASTAFSAPSQAITSITLSSTIPSWAFVGLGKIYVDAYTALPSNGGVAYCPEKTVTITIGT